MMSLRNAMDRLVENAFVSQPEGWEQTEWGLALDVVENEDEYLVKASVPGIKPDDLEISFVNNTLTIQGEIKPEEREENRYHLRERRWGRFTRSIQLPANVNGDQIQANYDAGVLTLHLPKVEEAKPRRISIKSGASQKVIEG
jgi:HSP20 family protein